jgi:pyridoxal 5'-phosphate synthase pdxT subunit
MKIGVLAVQGDFGEHAAVLVRLSVQVQEVRLSEHLYGLDGLIIPGGESTTIGKLAVDYGLFEPLRAFGKRKAIWGTCAGAILLSKDVKREQPLLELMDIAVERNAFGRQTESFEIGLDVPVLKEIDDQERPFPAIFIRAPLIEAVQNGTQALARLPDGNIVAAQQGHLLATSFHPELVDDDRFHKYFLKLVEETV